MTSKNVFSSVFHSVPSHSIIKHILFAPHPSLEHVVINYLFRLANLGILKSVILLSLLPFLMLLSCEKKVLLRFLKKRNFKFWTVIATTNKALVIILWYSEWINRYDKNLAHLRLLSLALKIRYFESFSFFIYWGNNKEQVNINKVLTIIQISIR